MAHAKQIKEPVRIALIEPSEPDARWFEIVVDETRLPASIMRYRTGAAALQAWSQLAPSVDLIVMPDRLPMLTVQEFVDRAKELCPDVRIVIAGERLRDDRASSLPAGVQWFTKPLSCHDIALLGSMTTELPEAHYCAAGAEPRQLAARLP